MKQTIITLLLVAIIVVGLFYVGGTILALGLSVVALTALIFLSFALGAKWAQHLVMSGLEASARNAATSGQHEAAKTKALVDLVREVMKTKHEPSSSSIGGYPPFPLLPSSVGQDDFRIEGLNGEEDEKPRDYQ